MTAIGYKVIIYLFFLLKKGKGERNDFRDNRLRVGI